MQNLNVSAESRGVVLFAFNSATVDYVKIADQTSRLIQKNLGLPVTLCTYEDATPKFLYDRIVRVSRPDSAGNFRTDLDDQIVEWRNFGRYLAYEHSPYNETILLDADYLVLDNSLNILFATDFDYRLMHHNSTPAGPSYEMMGETSLPFVWATVVLFRKTEKSRLFFNLVGRIQRNYSYYRALYNIREGNYRNDYAFAIANTIINGYTLDESQGIPWRMFTIEDKIVDARITGNSHIRVYHEDKAIVIPFQNTHIMDKDYLQSNNFSRMVGAICESA
jgi:hypothetical protein